MKKEASEQLPLPLSVAPRHRVHLYSCVTFQDPDWNHNVPWRWDLYEGLDLKGADSWLAYGYCSKEHSVFGDVKGRIFCSIIHHRHSASEHSTSLSCGVYQGDVFGRFLTLSFGAFLSQMSISAGAVYLSITAIVSCSLQAEISLLLLGYAESVCVGGGGRAYSQMSLHYKISARAVFLQSTSTSQLTEPAEFLRFWHLFWLHLLSCYQINEIISNLSH